MNTVLSLLAVALIPAASTPHVTSEAEIMKLPAGSAAWVGPEEPAADAAIALTADALKHLGPGSVLVGVDASGADLAGWKASGTSSIVGPSEAFDIAFDKAIIDGTHVAARQDIVKVLSAATVKSVVLEAPIFREGEPQTFTADEFRRIAAQGFAAFIDTIEDHPSFKCGGTMSAAEKTICQYADLAALDQLMQRTYKRSTAKKDAQHAFIKKRNACPADDNECVAHAYVDRLAELAPALDQAVRDRLQRGKIVYTAGPATPKGNDPIAAKLAKAYGSRIDGATLEPDFHIDAGSVGSNAHVCSLNAKLAPSGDGYYRDTNDATSVPLVILPDGIALGGTFEEQRALCGARAAWPGAFFTRD